MSSRGRPLERTRSIEDLHELRLMALLHDLVRKHRRKGAGEMLGVDPRTVKACLEQGALSKWMRTALEAQLLSREKAAMAAQQERIEALDQRMGALEQQITSGLGEMRTTMEGEIKALKDEHAGALRQWERRLAQVEAGYGGASAASVEKQPVTTGVTRRRYPELVTVEPALDDEAVYRCGVAADRRVAHAQSESSHRGQESVVAGDARAYPGDGAGHAGEARADLAP